MVRKKVLTGRMDPDDVDLDELFMNPATVRVFLYCLNAQSSVKLREAQRDLSVKSSSTVHWHLNKLIDAGFVKQQQDNTYLITDRGEGLLSLRLPVLERYIIIKGKLYPLTVFQLAFLSTSLLLTVIWVFINPITTSIFAILVIFSQIIFLVKNSLRGS